MKIQVQTFQQSIINIATVFLSVGLSLMVSVLATQQLMSEQQAEQRTQPEAAKNEPGALLRDTLDTGLFVEDVEQKSLK